MKNTCNVTPEAWAIIEPVEEAELMARRLKAVTTAFAETFTKNDVTGADIGEIRNRPEHFCYLFSTLELMVADLTDKIAAADNAASVYLAAARAAAEKTA